MASLECKYAIIELLTKYNIEGVSSVHYTVNEDDGDFTIEAHSIIRMIDGEFEDEAPYEISEDFAADLNELLFDFIDEFNGEDDPADGEIVL